jgi:hypothetical protein
LGTSLIIGDGILTPAMSGTSITTFWKEILLTSTEKWLRSFYKCLWIQVLFKSPCVQHLSLFANINICETVWKCLWKQLMTCPKVDLNLFP